MALNENLAFERIVLHGVGAGIIEIGVAADDLAVAEHDHAAAFADAPILQADVNRIQPVSHDVPMPAANALEASWNMMPKPFDPCNATG